MPETPLEAWVSSDPPSLPAPLSTKGSQPPPAQDTDPGTDATLHRFHPGHLLLRKPEAMDTASNGAGAWGQARLSPGKPRGQHRNPDLGVLQRSFPPRPPSITELCPVVPEGRGPLLW